MTNAAISLLAAMVVFAADGSDPAEHYQRGLDMAVSGYQFPEAIREFQAALDADPMMVEAMIGKATCHRALRQFARGRQMYDRALLLDLPEDLEWLTRRQLARMCVLDGDPDAAKAALQPILRLREATASEEEILGDIVSKTSDGAAAAAHYRRAIASDPGLLNARRGLARVYLEQGASVEAIRQAQTVVLADRHDAAMWYVLARALMNEGRVPEAQAATAIYQRLKRYTADIGQLRKKLRSGWSAALVAELASRHMREEAFEDAATTYGFLLNRAPDRASVLVNIAMLRVRQGRLGDAEETIEEARGLTGASASVFAAEGRLRYAQDQGDAARVAFESALSIDRTVEQARLGLAVIAREAGDVSVAESLLVELIELRPESAVAWTELAAVRGGVGAFVDAEIALSTALRMQPSYEPAATALARLYSEQGGDLATVEALLQRLLADWPSAELYYSLSLVHAAAGAYDKARDTVAAALLIDPSREEYAAQALLLRTRGAQEP